jgi:4-hydroxy-tetrahydrodipicolinate synthase
MPETSWRFKGVYPGLVTPFDENGVNETQYRGLIDYVIRTGANGIVPCASLGEFTSMTFEEKVEAIRIACEAAKGRVPVLAGACAAYTDEVVKLYRKAAELGASAALVVSPYFMKPSTKEIYEHYEKVSNAGDMPVFLYNCPQLTGVNLDWWLVEGLREIKGVVGLSDASGNAVNLLQILARRPEDFQVVVGNDEVVLPSLAAGCDGAILAGANIFPDRYVRMMTALSQGDLKEARLIQRSIQRAARILVNKGGPLAIKTALNMIGLPVGKARMPLMQGDTLGYDDVDELRALLEDLQLMPRGPVTFKVRDRSLVAEAYPKAVGVTRDVIDDLTLLHGEALCGEGLEVAHVDLVMGLKDGPMQVAVANAGKQVDGFHSSNIIKDIRPTTVFAPTVTITDEHHSKLVFEFAQRAVADAVTRMITDRMIPEELVPDLVIAVKAFVHPGANNPRRVHMNNFRATRFAIRRALEGRQFVEDIVSQKDSARHPFAYNP